MKNLSFLLMSFVLFLAACQGGASSASSDNLIGTWTIENIEVNNEAKESAVAVQFKSFSDMMKGMKPEMEFQEDGKMSIGMMIIQLKGKYELDGDNLMLQMNTDNLPPEMKDAAKSQNNEAIFRVEKMDNQTLKLHFPKDAGFFELKRKG
ncbi:MAG: hypothetical protein ACKVTZ_24380 [Bacteroidia bacterium]